MKGNVIGFDADTNTGAISGHDGHRYEFATADWHSHGHQPKHGDLVDFAPEGQRATQIYLLEPEYVPPTFSQFLFSTRGRISRSQYWLKWALPIFIIIIVLLIWVAVAIGQQNRTMIAVSGGIFLVFYLITLWPNIAIMVKRIHDRNKTGWFALFFFIPSVLQELINSAEGRDNPVSVVLSVIVLGVGIWFFIEFGCMRGTVGANRFGPDPVRPR
jgi:uncharacterized membrane protein YhaH (DUF805 family)